MESKNYLRNKQNLNASEILVEIWPVNEKKYPIIRYGNKLKKSRMIESLGNYPFNFLFIKTRMNPRSFGSQ